MQALHVKAPGTAGGAAVQAQESTDTAIFIDRVAALKASLMARAANANVPIYETGEGGYIVGGWAGGRSMPDLRSLRMCLSALGVQ